MAERRWTPGPWRYYTRGRTTEVQDTAGGPPVVAWLGFDDSFRTLAEHRANAHLIAAAPDLYEDGYVLAMAALQSNRYAEDPDYRDAVDNMLASLARARGEGA